MERRTFVKGAFGLVVAVAGADAFSALQLEQAAKAPFYTTPVIADAGSAIGPVMQPAVSLARTGEGIAGFFGESKLFVADEVAATLIMLADGTRSLDGIAREAAASLGTALDPADVASFFVELGQAGFLMNGVYVNLYQVTA